MSGRDSVIAVEIVNTRPFSGDDFIAEEQKVAIHDLIAGNRFQPQGLTGPFRLQLSADDDTLIFDIADENGANLLRHAVSLVPLRRTVKDYVMVCNTYYAALRQASPSRVEAIDMGRRSLHNEGAETLRDGLDGAIDIDFETARRLFTLVCALSAKTLIQR